jgi:hypothetical protein
LSLLGPNILNTPFSNTLNLRSSLKVSEQISHPFKTTGNGAWGWQPYHLHVPIVLKSGSFNLLEPSRSVQTCNGIALP